MAFRINRGIWQFKKADGSYESKYKINTSGQLVETDTAGNEIAGFTGSGIAQSTADTRYLQITGGTVTGAAHFTHTSNTYTGASYKIGDANTHITKNGDGAIKVQTPSGYVVIGPGNTSYSHFSTDRGRFYFNQQIEVAGHVSSYSNGTYNLGSTSLRWGNLYTVDINASGTATLSKAYINGASDNSGKSDFSVYTGGTASLALTGGELRVGDTDVNWTVALRSSGWLGTYGTTMTIGTSAGNYAVIMSPNGTTSAEFYSDSVKLYKTTSIITGTPTGATTVHPSTMLLIDSSSHQFMEFRTSSSASGIMQGTLYTDNGRNAFIGYKEYTGAVAATYGESLHFAIRDYSASDAGSGFYFGTTTDPAAGVQTPIMFIRSNGRVGIGTTNPIYPFQVVGNAYVNGGTLFLDSTQYLRWGDSNQGIVGENNNGVSIVAGGSTRQTIYGAGYTYFPGLDLAISNANSDHGKGTYFRGSSSYFVLGLTNGNTLYLNYGNAGGSMRTYGTVYHNDVNIGTPWGTATNLITYSGADVNAISRTMWSSNSTGNTAPNRLRSYAQVFTLPGQNALQLSTNDDYYESALWFRQYNHNAASPNGTGWQSWKKVATEDWVSDLIVAPGTPGLSTKATNGDGIAITFTAAANAEYYEIWSSVGNTTSYGLVGKVDPSSVASTMSYQDDTPITTGTIYYRIYAINKGRYGTPLEFNHAFSYTVADPAVVNVVSTLNAFFITWEPSNSRLCSGYTVTHHASSGTPAQGSGTTIYTGKNTVAVYSIPDGELDLNHQFWVTANTN